MLGAIAGVLGSLMAIEAMREILGGFGDGDEGLVGRLLVVDLKGMRFETLRYGWDEANPLSGLEATPLAGLTRPPLDSAVVKIWLKRRRSRPRPIRHRRTNRR